MYNTIISNASFDPTLYQPVTPNQMCYRKKKIPSPEAELEYMSVKQVCNWIGELGKSQGWENKDILAHVESFRLKEIDGRRLVNLTVKELHDMDIVWKLGHKIAITRAVTTLKKSTMVMEKFFHAFGRPVSSSEERAISEPSPVRRFERGKAGRMRSREGNSYKPIGGWKQTENKVDSQGSLFESDVSSRSLRSMPIIYDPETLGISPRDKPSTSDTLGQGEKLDLIPRKSHTPDHQNAGDNDKVRVSYVHEEPKKEPKEIRDLSDSDEAETYVNPYNVIARKNLATKTAESSSSDAESSIATLME